MKVDVTPPPEWERGDRTDNLSETGKQLAARARQRMGGYPLKIDVGPYSVPRWVGGETERKIDEKGNRWVTVGVWCERVPSDGSGDVDYNLAHELGHAIRIATDAEPDELKQMYRTISGTQQFRPTSTDDAEQAVDAKRDFMRTQPEHIQKMIVEDEKAAWAIAKELFEGIPHDVDRLKRLAREGIKGYEEGLLL